MKQPQSINVEVGKRDDQAVIENDGEDVNYDENRKILFEKLNKRINFC